MAEDPDKKRKAAVIASSIASARAKIEQEQVELATIASGGVREMESQVRVRTIQNGVRCVWNESAISNHA